LAQETTAAQAINLDWTATGDSVAQLSLGAVFRPTADSALKLSYTRGRAFDRFHNRSDHAALLFSLSTYF
jgi:hypothetical protein